MSSSSMKILSLVVATLGIVSLVMDILSLEQIKNTCNNQFVITDLYVNIVTSSLIIIAGIYGYFFIGSKSTSKFAFG